jgi:hypothetical protein
MVLFLQHMCEPLYMLEDATLSLYLSLLHASVLLYICIHNPRHMYAALYMLEDASLSLSLYVCRYYMPTTCFCVYVCTFCNRCVRLYICWRTPLSLSLCPYSMHLYLCGPFLQHMCEALYMLEDASLSLSLCPYSMPLYVYVLIIM